MCLLSRTLGHGAFKDRGWWCHWCSWWFLMGSWWVPDGFLVGSWWLLLFSWCFMMSFWWFLMVKDEAKWHFRKFCNYEFLSSFFCLVKTNTNFIVKNESKFLAQRAWPNGPGSQFLTLSVLDPTSLVGLRLAVCGDFRLLKPPSMILLPQRWDWERHFMTLSWPLSPVCSLPRLPKVTSLAYGPGWQQYWESWTDGHICRVAETSQIQFGGH